MKRLFGTLLGIVLVGTCSASVVATELSRVVSHEHPLFSVRASRMSVGRDGRVYLVSGERASPCHCHYVMSVERTGAGKAESEVPEAPRLVAANAAGIIATAHAHFVHGVLFWTSSFAKLGDVTDFLDSDQTDWSDPSDVEAGTSGDFYGLDYNRNRILRVASPGRVVAAYPLGKPGDPRLFADGELRIWERGRQFYVLSSDGTLRVFGFDGALRWSIPTGFQLRDGWRGGFDVDLDGRVLLIGPAEDTVRIFDAAGKAQAPLRLRVGDRKDAVTDLRVFEDDLVLKRANDMELFEVFGRASGALRRVVLADAERLEVAYPSDIWTAGVAVPLTISSDARGNAPLRPRVWLRPLEVPTFRELPIVDGHVTPPADAGGLYQLRVTPDIGGGGSDYAIDAIIEIRAPATRGSLSILTPENRMYFGQGEAIPVRMIARAPDPRDVPTRATVRLIDAGARVVAQSDVAIGGGVGWFVVSAKTTSALPPGRYALTSEATGLTIASQSLVIGPGIEVPAAFDVVVYGDYAAAFPTGGLFDAPENVASHLERARKLGVNMFADRLDADRTPLTSATLAARLKADPIATAPDKASFEGTIHQSVAAYGAHGIEERGILLRMDASLPLGTGYDNRTPAQLADAITDITTSFVPYPAFRGWSWAANWWVSNLGADAADGPGEKAAYQAALKKADETGAWDPVLDRVSDRSLSYAVDAERQLDAVLQRVAPGKLSVMTGPYRAVGVIPPITFQHADEVDLQFQMEQIQPPEVTPNNVDFYARAGKRAWGHPELWNDDGTGGMIFPTLFQMVMRGADGVGWSGERPLGWPSANGPRDTGPGATSVYRSMGKLLGDYGPWLTTLHADDRLAIVVSSRMLRIDRWANLGGTYFQALYEAYGACLYAHRPATFVFTEDVTPERLRSFRGVLVVGQRVELDPKLARALDAARAAGVKVFRDGTTRPELVPSAEPLGVSFDRIAQDPSLWNDDSAHVRIPGYFEKHAAALRVALRSIAPVADVSDPEVILTGRVSGRGRFVWVVDNAVPKLEPGLAWRTGLIISTRVPQVAPITLDVGAGEAVYDVFGQRRVDPTKGVAADLRALPARLYAILPRPIGAIELHAPSTVEEGQDLLWSVALKDDRGGAVPSSLPARVQLVAGDGSVLRESALFTDAERGVVAGRWTMPLEPIAGPVSLRAVELVSGKTVSLPIAAIATKLPDLVRGPSSRSSAAAALPKVVVGRDADAAFPPIEQRFGPHLKDMAVSTEGDVALFNAMSLDQNLYALDLATGGVRWRRRLGHHFGYGPRSTSRGFAVEAFDQNTAEGYHLYLLDPNGQPQRRFALYGLPKRATNWMFGSQLLDPIDNFAVSPAGDWVASAGDLGMVVWGRDGQRLWSLDWWKTSRRRVVTVAQDRNTLVILEGAFATAYEARTGRQRWTTRLSSTGKLLGAVVGAGGTLAIRGDAKGGRVFVVRDGKLVSIISAAADEIALAPDGKSLALARGNKLCWYGVDGRLAWSVTGDDELRGPRIGADGRVAVASELGTLYVLDGSGRMLWEHDYAALPVASWLAGGDLLVGTWMGDVERLDERYRERWHAHLAPTTLDVRAELLAADPTPTTRVDSWGNAAATSAPLTPNLLTNNQALITASLGDKRQDWAAPIAALTDGKPDPPASPWLTWTAINYIDSGWSGSLSLGFDAFNTQLKVRGITFVEDPAHPESWLRDVRLQYWDAGAESWRDGPYLLSNAATHTHWLDRPIEASRFRFVSTGGGTWPVGNVRLGELVVDGERLGPSHPDALAKRPVAVLFDERSLSAPFSAVTGAAYSGGSYLALAAPGIAVPRHERPFGEVVRDWDFEIAEHPGPDQYRWLQFAWKASSPSTTGVGLMVGTSPGSNYSFVAGEPQLWGNWVMVATKVAERPPENWQVVRVDLWKAMKGKPVALKSLGLSATGGGAAFDQILLGRTEEDLRRVPRLAP